VKTQTREAGTTLVHLACQWNAYLCFNRGGLKTRGIWRGTRTLQEVLHQRLEPAGIGALRDLVQQLQAAMESTKGSVNEELAMELEEGQAH